MRSILRAILAVALLLGGGAGDWALAGDQAASAPHECCCGAMPGGMEDSCPCPKPEGNRTPLRGACAERQVVVAPAARRSEQGQRRTEPRPEPAGWAAAPDDSESAFSPNPAHGRDPDLGRHLARLNTLRI